MSKRRICIYVDHWSNGGEESYVMNLLRNWDLCSVEIEILTAQIETERYNEELSKLHVALRTILPKHLDNPITRMLKTSVSIRKVFMERDYDVIYFQMANAVMLYYCHLAKKVGVKSRPVHSHCASISRGRGYFVKIVAHRICRLLFGRTPTQYLACSDLAAKWLFPKRFASPPSCIYIPNGIKLERFRFDRINREQIRQELGLEERFVLGTVGRCEEQKNHSFLLSLMNVLSKIMPEAILLLVGEGALLDSYKKRAEELGLADKFIFYGASHQVPALLCAMDAFLLPSFFEGNPISCVEAQANGLPCLLADTITRQAKITDYVSFLPIDQGPQPWVEALCFLREEKPSRKLETTVLKDRGFDISDTAKHVWDLIV